MKKDSEVPVRTHTISPASEASSAHADATQSTSSVTETPLELSAIEPSAIPDSWPSPGLEETIDAGRPFWTDKRVLITGAFGFVGGHLTRALHAAGARVTALDIETRPSHSSQIDMVNLRDEIEIIEADITHPKAMNDIVRDGHYDFIFHLAAGATTVECAMKDPYGTILANTMGFVNLAEAARRLPTDERPVLLYSSTDKVYGETENLPYDEATSELRGVGVYDAAKLAADIFAATYHQALGLDTIVLRMCNLFGPYDMNYDYRLIPKAMRNIFRDNDAPDLYFSSLQHHRDYLFVEDAARAFMMLAQEPACRGHVFNLPGAHYAATPDVLRDVVELIVMMQEDALRAGDTRLGNLEWNRHIRLIQADSSVVVISKQHLSGIKIKQTTGFEPSISFRDGLRRTALFYLWFFMRQNAPQSTLDESGEDATAAHDVFAPVSPNGTMATADISSAAEAAV